MPNDKYQKLILEFVRILSKSDDEISTVNQVLEFAQNKIGLDAVAVRLEKGFDFPYLTHTGMADSFIVRENSLFCGGESLGLGYECVCGQILSCGFSDELPECFDKKREIFYSNDLPSLAEKLCIPCGVRGTCLEYGFNSMVLIPFRSDKKLIGLIQYCSKSINFFTEDLIDFLTELSGFISSIISRIHEKNKLKANELKYKNFYNELSIGYLIFNIFYIDGNNQPNISVEDINNAAKRIFDYDWDTDSENLNLSALNEKSVFDKIRKEIADNIHGNDFSQFDLNIKNDLREFRVSAFKLQDRLIGCTVEDITESITLHHKLHQLEKMNSIGQLAAGIAHDFNNMLEVITGYTELNMELSKDPDIISNCNEVIVASERSSALTRQLLTFSRSQMQHKAVDINQCVKNMGVLLCRTIDKKIKVEVSTCNGPLYLKGDQAHIENAILNLGINSRDAISGEGLICIETGTIDLDKSYVNQFDTNVKPGKYVYILVQDDGHGISEALTNKVFEPFYTTKKAGHGTGLGLSSVYSTVVAHHGLIELKSKPGEGTGIKMMFPYISCDSLYVEERKSVTTSYNEEHMIMAIDDEKQVLGILNSIFNSMNVNGKTFSNPADFIKEYSDNSKGVDLVIIDMIMPKMNGMDLIKIIREINPEQNVVIISGYYSEAQKRELSKIDNIDLLHKPFKKSDFTQFIWKKIRG